MRFLRCKAKGKAAVIDMEKGTEKISAGIRKGDKVCFPIKNFFWYSAAD